jgi:ribA/ribD-fused uncharacterized protein
MKDVDAKNIRGVINGFCGAYRFLSNDCECEIYDYEGNKFKSSEAMFHSYRTIDPDQRVKFTKMTPQEARDYVIDELETRSDWDDIKYDAMWYVIYQKFAQNRSLAKLLIETGRDLLIYENTDNDLYWGMIPDVVPVGDSETTTLNGQNRLGRILMQVREIMLDQHFPIYKQRNVYPHDEENSEGYAPWPKTESACSKLFQVLADRRTFREYLTTKNKMMKSYFGTSVADKIVSSQVLSETKRINDAIDVAWKAGGVEGDHHKAWVIDQMLRKLLSTAEYNDFLTEYEKSGEYKWDPGIAP